MKVLAFLLVLAPSLMAILGHAHEHQQFFSKLRIDNILSNSLKLANPQLASKVFKGIPDNQMRKSLLKVPHTKEVIYLDDAYFHINEDTTVELTQVHLRDLPIVHVTSIEPDLEFLNMKINFKLPSVHIEGKYDVANKKVLSFLPVTSVGTFSIGISEVAVSGKIGLALEGDSFTTHNYDLTYEPRDMYVSVTHYTAEGPVVSEIATNQLGGSLVSKLTRALGYELNQILKRQIDEVIVEASVSDLLGGDEDLKETYRLHTRAMTVLANEYVDEVLKFAGQKLEESGQNQVSIPDIDASFSQKVWFVTWYGGFYAHNGWVKSLASIVRVNDVSISYDDGKLTIFGSIGLGELGLGYEEYSAKFMGIGPEGSFRVGVGRNSLFVKVSVSLGSDPGVKLEELKVEHIGGIEIEITGLGILSWLISKIASWVTGLFNDQIAVAVEGFLWTTVNNGVNSIDPTIFFN